MNMLISILATLLVGATATAQNVQPFYRDIKLPRQAVLEVQSFGAPLAASNTMVLDGYVGPESAAAHTLTSFDQQPDVPRNLVIIPGDTTADVAATTLTVSGTNIAGASINETFVFSANQTTAVTGAKAFKTVSSVVWPAGAEDSPFSASWSIGVGEKIGLRKCMADAGSWGWSSIDGVKEATEATVVADADEVEKNVADFNGTMDGAAVFKGYFIQNYSCYP